MGACKTNGATTEICLLFEGPYGKFYTIPQKIDGQLHLDRLLSGRCKFKKDWFSINNLARDELFDNQYETLTFRRYARDEVDWVDGWPVPKIEQSKQDNRWGQF